MNKVITVLGNTGKTTLSYFLAEKLSANGKKVMVLSTDNTTPTLQLILPEDKKGSRSLGRVLSLAVISPKDIFDNMITLKNSNLGFLSYATFESKNTYPEITVSNLEALFELLKNIVDYIIVDTQTAPNQIDSFAIDTSDIKLCITSANLKGLAYRQHASDEDIVHVLYNDNAYNPYEDISHTFKKNVRYNLPLCKQLNALFNTNVLADISCPKKYAEVIDRIVKEVINVEQ